jgi:hypothetical protein
MGAALQALARIWECGLCGFGGKKWKDGRKWGTRLGQEGRNLGKPTSHAAGSTSLHLPHLLKCPLQKKKEY